MESWYLLCHKAGKDNLYRAQLSIQLHGINTFSPMIQIEKPRTDRASARLSIEPLFYGYLFISLDPDYMHPARIEDFAGVSHFVRCGDEIKPIPERIVEQIMALPACQIELSGKNLRSHLRNANALSHKLRARITEIAHTTDKQVRTAMFLAMTEGLRCSH